MDPIEIDSQNSDLNEENQLKNSNLYNFEKNIKEEFANNEKERLVEERGKEEILDDYIDSFFDHENSYENFEKDEHLYKEERIEPVFSFSPNKDLSSDDKDLENQILDIAMVEYEEVNPMDKYVESQNIEGNIYYNPEDLTTDEPVEINITNSDGTMKTIVLGEVEKTETKEEIIKKQLIELKEYINDNKKNIDSIDVKKGTKFHKKIPLKDFLNKELNTTNYSSNPDKMGEDIILSLLKPLKVYNNYLAQNKLENSNNHKLNESIDKNIATLSINNAEYKFIKYTDDFKKIVVADEKNKSFAFDNNKNINFIIPPEKTLNEMQLGLIHKGKSLIIKEKIPFKILSENGEIKFQTITNDDYIKNIDIKSEHVKSNKHSNNIQLKNS